MHLPKFQQSAGATPLSSLSGLRGFASPYSPPFPYGWLIFQFEMTTSPFLTLLYYFLRVFQYAFVSKNNYSITYAIPFVFTVLRLTIVFFRHSYLGNVYWTLLN